MFDKNVYKMTLKLKTQLHIVKYWLWVQKFLR